MSEIIEKVKRFVENECKKSTSKYGYQPFFQHFIPVVDYAKVLAEKEKADAEIVEISAWLHDIGSIIHGRENHNITGAKIAEEKLKEWGYPKEKINRVVHCILAHRGSREIKRQSKEAQIIADADAMSAFNNAQELVIVAIKRENKSEEEAKKSVKTKLINSFNKMSPHAKEDIKSKYGAAMLLLGK